jgi:hypothetical protein
MSVTQSQICNLALAHIKQTQTLISNLDTDEGNVADILRLHYDIARQYVLNDHKWNFATKRESLALISDSASTRWTYQYSYPNNCISMREVETNDLTTPIPFEIQNYNDDTKCVFTNQANAIGVFTFDATNPLVFSSGFVNAFSWYLASEIAPALSEDSRVQEACLTVYRNTITKARTMDSNEGEADATPDAAWDRARIGGILP